MKLRWFLCAMVHVSWQLTALCLGFLAGVGLALWPLAAVFAHWVWLLLAAILCVWAFAKSQRYLLGLALVAGLLLGIWRGTIQRVDLGDYGRFLGETQVVEGKVFEDPSWGMGGDLRLRLSEVVIDGYELPGQVWLSVVGQKPEVRRSDTVQIEGKLKRGFGTFPASMNFAKVVGWQPGHDDPARDLRDEFGQHLEAAISQPAQSLGMGILAGQKTALPSGINEAFRVAGLPHIVVASGYNLTILIRFGRRAFAKVSRLVALLGSGALMLGFACVTGFGPSMTRAALVAGASLLAWYLGRKFHPVVLICTIAALTVLINPMYVWGDAGWYMSFLSFTGVIILAPLVRDYFWQDVDQRLAKEASVRRPASSQSNLVIRALAGLPPKLSALGVELRQIVVETMSAQVMTMPIIALLLGQVAVYGLLSNLLVLPIVPLTMLLTFLAGLVAWVWPGAAALVGWPAQKLLDYIIWVSQQVEALPGAALEVSFGIGSFLVAMGLLLAAMIYMWYKTHHNFRGDNLVT